MRLLVALSALSSSSFAKELAAGEVVPAEQRTRYPELVADNLLGDVIRYPDWFQERPSLVLVVWTQEQQRVANTWLAALPELAEQAPTLSVVENPVVAPAWKLAKGTVDGWMRSGIVESAARARTVTLYVGAPGLAKRLGIADRSTITALLVDGEGRIAKRWLGAASPERLADVAACARHL